MYSLINKQYTSKPKVIEGKKVDKISIFDNPFIYFVSDDFSYYERSLYGVVFANTEKENILV